MSGLLLYSPANIAVRSGAEKARVRGRVSLSGEGPWNCPAIFQDLPAHARSLNARNAESAFIFLNGQNASTDVACGPTCTTTDFIHNAFGSSATFTTGDDWWFSYKTGNKAACASHWINAAYGNSGDIATNCA